MRLPLFYIRLSVAAAFCMAAASFSGIVWGGAYAHEAPAWAAQGIGQDIVNLFLVFPALLLCAYGTHKGSMPALLTLLGLLVYCAYSYVLYAFFVTFGPLFLVYVSALGLSFYALLGSVLTLAKNVRFPEVNATWRISASVYLFVNGLLFAFLWLSEIVRALMQGAIPQSAADLHMVVNPVHVLDLAFILPAMLSAAVLLWRKEKSALLFAMPVIVFAACMGLAIVSMIFVSNARGIPTSFVPAILMAVNAVLAVWIGVSLLRRIQ